MFREKCLICEGKFLKEILDLGMHPFADTFLPKESLAHPDHAYPLICDLCPSCGQIQLRCVTDPQKRYAGIDYSYTSANSNFSRTHWDTYAKEVIQKINLSEQGVVVEIGSNDGYLTEKFVAHGCRGLGVDPSPYMAALAKERGVVTLIDLFDLKTARTVLNTVGKADLIVANNVFNHSNDPLNFARAVESLLSPNGVFVFELPYWAISIESKKFDQIYHEHVSYFTARSSASILERAGMRIFSIEVVDYHGGSLRVYAKKQEVQQIHCEELNTMVEKEKSLGLFDHQTYQIFMEQLLSRRDSFLKKIVDLRAQGKSIIAVGAAAKGNTFLNFYRLDHSLLDFVTDSSPHKQGKFTPLTRIPITGDEIFARYPEGEACALILSWNLVNHLKPLLFKINPHISFISPEEPTHL